MVLDAMPAIEAGQFRLLDHHRISTQALRGDPQTSPILRSRNAIPRGRLCNLLRSFTIEPRPPSESRKYLPDFIVLVDDGHGDDDRLHLVVEIKGYRREDAKEKKSTMDTYWVPGVNNLGSYGRWAFAEFTDVYEIGADFEAKVAKKFDQMIAAACTATHPPSDPDA